MENVMINDFILTTLWTTLNTLGAIQLYDGFSKRQRGYVLFYFVTITYIVLDSIILNTPLFVTNSVIKMLFSIAIYSVFHLIQYTVNGVFCVCIAIIFYATICCTENLVFTTGIICSTIFPQKIVYNDSLLSLISGLLVILICSALKRQRIVRSAKVSSWQWYSIPTILSLFTTLLVFYFGECYHSREVSIRPLFICSIFLTLLQVVALFLVSWMELNSRFREETLNLNAKAQTQQESIEALSIAYAQQRKLTHDFQSHVDVLDALLSDNSVDVAKRYLQNLQNTQTDRILLVNTRNPAIDALLNQKASVAMNRKIDIQFSVNDLSPVVIDITDLTVLISNVFDNAIEASEKLSELERRVFVKVLLEDHVLFFSVRNRSIPVTIIPGQLPSSTKKDATFHGYGLKNVKTVLAKYDAICSINYDAGWFSFATELPNIRCS